MSEQAENLARVDFSIGYAVRAFVQRRFKRAKAAGFDTAPFHGADLLDYVRVMSSAAIAPDSPGRVLRLLRKTGTIDYKVVSRARSLYEVTRA